MDEKLAEQLKAHRQKKAEKADQKEAKDKLYSMIVLKQEAEMIAAFQKAADHLRDATLARWFEAGVPGRVIANVLGLTEGRVSQLRNKIFNKK